MIIGIDMGHTLTGAGTGAVGVVKETDKNREVGKRLIEMLQEKGHTVVNCTVDKSNCELKDRVALANKQKLDLFVSLHLNAYNSHAYGVETYIYSTSSSAYTYAQRIQVELVKQIGWANRGVKTNKNLYVLKNTTAPALLVELGFCDNASDMAKWNTEKIAKALFYGITGVQYTGPAPTNTTSGSVYRVSVNGTQVGAYGKVDNILSVTKEQLNKGTKEIIIRKV